MERPKGGQTPSWAVASCPWGWGRTGLGKDRDQSHCRSLAQPQGARGVAGAEHVGCCQPSSRGGAADGWDW